MADSNLITIKKIRTSAGDHLIDATYLNGYTFDEIRGMFQGVAGTYVIPTSSSDKEGYNDVVKSIDSIISTTKSNLNDLTGASEDYKLGDIILMEEVSDGIKVFDRWISSIDGDNITLAVLETQVATHHHTIDVNTGSALKGVTSTTTTTNAIPIVGSEVTVLDGTDVPTVVTSVSHDDNGSYSFELSSESGEGSVGHSHNIDAHDHSVSFTPSSLVGETIDVYTSLSTDTYIPHTHTTTTVAGSHLDGTALTYATGSGNTDTFVKTLKDSQSTTGDVSLTTNYNSDGLSTSTQLSTDAVGDIVKTTSVSSHTHSVEAETISNVVTDIDIPGSVVTDIDFTYVSSSVQEVVVIDVECDSANVVSSVTATPTTSSFINGCSVDENGILSFGFASALTDIEMSISSTSVLTGVEPIVALQSGGHVDVSPHYALQKFTSGKVKSTCNTGAAGEHTHGFSHTHVIPSHIHTIASHSHTYNKSVTDSTGSAYTFLNTESYIPHTHENTTVIANATNDSEFTYVTGGSKTSVIGNLKDDVQNFTTTSSSLITDDKYVKLSGDITFPGLTVGTKTLSTTTVTPAVVGTEKPLISITFASGDFVTNVSDKTSINIGGDGKTNE